MVYVDRSGSVREQRPIWTPSGLYYYMVALFNFIVLFFRSLINPTLTKYGSNTETTNYRLGRGGGGGGGGGSGRHDRPPDARPRRRFGGFSSAGAGPGCSPMAGG